MQEEIQERRKAPVNRMPNLPTPSIRGPEIRAPKIDDLLSKIDDVLKKKLPERYNPCKC